MRSHYSSSDNSTHGLAAVSSDAEMFDAHAYCDAFVRAHATSSDGKNALAHAFPTTNKTRANNPTQAVTTPNRSRVTTLTGLRNLRTMCLSLLSSIPPDSFASPESVVLPGGTGGHGSSTRFCLTRILLPLPGHFDLNNVVRSRLALPSRTHSDEPRFRPQFFKVDSAKVTHPGLNPPYELHQDRIKRP